METAIDTIRAFLGGAVTDGWTGLLTRASGIAIVEQARAGDTGLRHNRYYRRNSGPGLLRHRA